MNSKKFLVTFVRHGETYMNFQKLIQGHSDNELSETGVQQAKKLGRHLTRTTFTKAYSSDLQRANKTAKLILNELITSIPENALLVDVLLRERCFGEAEGKPVQELIDNAAKSNVKVQDYVPNGAESIEDLGKRTEDFFRILCLLSERSITDENVLVVTHGGWIQGLMRHLHTNDDKYQLENFSPSLAIRIPLNTGVTVISVSPNHNTDNTNYKIKFLQTNDITHLNSE